MSVPGFARVTLDARVTVVDLQVPVHAFVVVLASERRDVVSLMSHVFNSNCVIFLKLPCPLTILEASRNRTLITLMLPSLLTPTLAQTVTHRAPLPSTHQAAASPRHGDRGRVAVRAAESAPVGQVG